ncbi:hypothetical protein GCM10010532_091060 [Dactylosporangium siamense]|uniref:FIST domain-containing protein n=1 Tax=Dactylosporangium siamense TaxID=685454 RepID=A0A919UH45_9ACTN|nr:hypothetical protein Dsi01nite_100720 [Dactylosporangium siamense]
MGTSGAADPRAAGATAARAAVGDRDDARLLMVFCSALHDPVAVLAGIRPVAGATPLIGCSTTAVIAAGQSDVDSGVSVVALGGPGFDVTTGVSLDVSGRQREAGAEVTDRVTRAGTGRRHQVLVLLTDGLVVGQEEMLAGAYSVVGASMPMVGGASTPHPTAARHTFQFHGDQVVADAVVGAVIASDGPFGVGLRHGWRKVGEPMIVTKSDRNEVLTLDDRPAVEAYLSRLGAPPEAFADPPAFERFAECRPIGVRSRGGEVVRNVGNSSGLARGVLCSSGEVPEGGVIWPMEGDVDTVLQAADDACRDAVAGLAGAAPLGLIAFDCETRARLLGPDGQRREVRRMAAHARPAPLAGLYTWGEVARTKGINAFHNQTLVVLAVG